MTDTIYRCPKGHTFSGRISLIARDGDTVEALPYVGDYCTVCYFAWIAQNVPRVTAEETAEQF